MIERVVVGRKTARDGKLEVSPALAAAIGGHGAKIDVQLHGHALPGMVSVLECTCTKASASGKHEHHFVQCEAFRDLTSGTELRLTADEARLEIALG